MPASGMPISTSIRLKAIWAWTSWSGTVAPSRPSGGFSQTTAIIASKRACAAHDEVAERHDAGLERRCARQHDGDDAAADVGAEHQHDAKFCWHETSRGKRDDQQDGRDAGMEQPRHDGGEQEGRDRVAGKIVHHHRQDLALAQRLGSLADHPQRQDEQADADQDASELQEVAARRGHEQRRAGDQADRHQDARDRS